MRALVITGPGSARVSEVEDPVPLAGQVVVDVRRAGICGTDAELFTGQLAYFGQGKTRFPVRPGHEWCGVVSAVGEEVPDEWLGVRVTGDTMLGCGRCARCLADRRHVCADRYEVGIMGGWPGALAERVVVPAWSLHRLPDSLDDRSGALVEPGGNAWRAASAAGAAPGRRVLVCGPGTIGLLTTAFAAAAGAEVHLLALDDGRRPLASSFGATGYWTTDDPPPVTYDAVVDCTDDHRVPALALALAEPGGRVVFIGVSGVPSLIDSRDLVLGDLTAVGILGASAGLAPAIEHYADGRVDPAGLVSVTVGLDQAAEALAGQISTGSGTKIHIDPALPCINAAEGASERSVETMWTPGETDMPVPRHSTAVASVQLPQVAALNDVTELRVHGVGGSPPDAILGDLAPEQASGDQIAGFYRSNDHRASPEDQMTGSDADRHVECYSWGGLTSRSKVRVLWLALLPFLLANLAGWMCSVRTRQSRWRFGLHRLSHALSGLALTVNAVLIAVLIAADLLAYQAVRAGRAGHQWWLAPLGWPSVSGHPARQVLVGVLVPVLFLLLLAGLARRSWRYEQVQPPFKAGHERSRRTVSAAALDGGLADDQFWDGENSVRALTHLHFAVAAGFLAIVLAVTAKLLVVPGSAHVIALWWIAVAAGGAAVACAVAYIGLDSVGALGDTLRRSGPFLLVLGAAALVSSGVFAWLQPGGAAGPAVELPGLAGVIRWTVLGIAVAVALAFVSMLLGLRRGGRTLIGGPWVTLMLAFVLLNTVMLGTAIWVAHLVGPVTSDAAAAGRTHAIYLSYVITSGVPLVAWAAVVTIVVFGVTELFRWWRTRKLPAATSAEYRSEAQAFVSQQSGPRKVWYLPGPDPDWERTVARTQFLSRAPLDAGWLLWSIIIVQVGVALCVWLLHWQPPVVIRNLGVGLTGLALPALMGFLYSAWNDPTRRRTIAVLWDVGTFWPRSYHPLAPPCYSERAVPELQRRMWWLHDNSGRVLLVAHSQGAMLATAALVQSGCRPQDDHPSLITFGSPVVKLYGWGFPAYVTPELLTPLAPDGPGGVDDWRNHFYPTDPIGGPVAVDVSEDRRVDQDLLDPAQCWYVYGQPAPAPQGHSGYWADPRVWAVVNRMAATGPRIPVGTG